jgi:hypothetical protein
MHTKQTAGAGGFRCTETPGVVFRDGKLHVFTKKRVVVLRGGEQPACWAKTAARPTWFSSLKLAEAAFPSVKPLSQSSEQRLVGLDGDRPLYADGQLCFPFFCRFVHNDLAKALFLGTVPPAIKSRLQRFFLRGQWSLYRLLARCPGSDDLVDCNPALAFALANSRGFHPVSRPLDSARRLLRRKQRDILGWLGFPATDRARRVLAKVPAEQVSVPVLFRLRRILQRDAEAANWLSHLPRITDETINILTFYRAALSMPLLLDLQGADTRSEYWYYLFEGSNRMRKEYDLPWTVFRSMEALSAFYERLSRRTAMDSALRELPKELPPPPFALSPDSGIEPIATVQDLYWHGELEHNCVLQYARAIHAGTHYVYRVTSPVRATLSIVRKGKDWVPDGLMGPANCTVDDAIGASLFRRLLEGPEEAETAGPDVVPPFD